MRRLPPTYWQLHHTGIILGVFALILSVIFAFAIGTLLVEEEIPVVIEGQEDFEANEISIGFSGGGDGNIPDFRADEAGDLEEFLAGQLPALLFGGIASPGVPTIESVILNTTDPTTNTSSENLTVYVINAADDDGDPVHNITDWRLDSTSMAVVNMPFETNVSASTANAVRDYSTNENNGTLANPQSGPLPQWNNSGGILGGYYIFDGINSSVDVAFDASIPSSGDFTVMAWARFNHSNDSATSKGQFLSKRLGSGTFDQWNLAVRAVDGCASGGNGGSAFCFLVGDTTTGFTGAASVDGYNDDAWHHVVGVMDGTTMLLYVDGALADSDSTSADFSNTEPLIIGKLGGLNRSDFAWNGSIDEVKIFNRALSSVQIKSIYDNGIAGERMRTLVSDETSKNEVWTVAVTPNDNGANSDGATITSNNITIDSGKPKINQVILNTTNPATNKSDTNLTAYMIGVTDSDGDPVQNITDWRLEGTSIATLNMPFETNRSSAGAEVGDYGTVENNGSLGDGEAARVPTWDPVGQVGGAYEFDGSDDKITVAHHSSLIPNTGSFTVAVWVNADVVSSTDRIVFKADSASFGDDGYILMFNSGTFLWTIGDGTNGRSRSTGSIDTGVWYHVAGVRDVENNAVSIYLNGTLISTQGDTTGTIDTTATLHISGRPGADAETMDGHLDEIFIAQRALTSDQIKVMYDAGRAGHHMNEIVFNETAAGETWNVAVTPNDNQPNTDGTTVISNSMMIVESLPPTISQVIINFTDPTSNNTFSDNLTAYIIGTTDPDSESVMNITDWREHGSSFMVLNLPFETNVTNVSNSSVKDYTSFANYGTLGNGNSTKAPTWNLSGQVGGAYIFDGVNDFIQVASSSSLTTFTSSAELTVSAWVFPNDPGTNATIISKGNDTTRDFVLGKVGTKLAWYYYDDTSTLHRWESDTAWSTLFPNDRWTHVTVQHNTAFAGGDISMYVNGSLITGSYVTGGGSIPEFSTNDLYIGATSSSGMTDFFNGSIDEVYIFDRSANNPGAAQVLFNYNEGLAGHHIEKLLANETSGGADYSITVVPNDHVQDGDNVYSNLQHTFANNIGCFINVGGNIKQVGNTSAQNAAVCFTVLDDNVIIDCDGFTIYGDFTVSTKSSLINATGINNLTIKNCIFRENKTGLSNHHQVEIVNSDGIQIYDNSFFHSGLITSHAIRLLSTKNAVVRNNLIEVRDGSSGQRGIFLDGSAPTGGAGDNNSIFNNTIIIDSSAGDSAGIYDTSVSSGMLIADNIILLESGSSANGIFYGIYSRSPNKTIRNNLIDMLNLTSDQGLPHIGINVFADPHVVVENNDVVVGGTNQSTGMAFAVVNATVINNRVNVSLPGIGIGIQLLTVDLGQEDSLVRNNTIFLNLTGSQEGVGIDLQSLNSSIVENNSIRMVTHPNMVGIRAEDSTNLSIAHNLINVSGSQSRAVEFDQLSDSVVANNILVEFTLGWLIVDSFSTFFNNTFFGAPSRFENSTLGGINFTQDTNITTYQNLSDIVLLELNKSFVNASKEPAMNASAFIDFHNLDIAGEPSPVVDFGDDGTFEACPTDLCTKIALNSTDALFNVSHWTTFSIQGEQLFECGLVNDTVTLGSDVSSAGTCFEVNGSGLTIDCNGFSITYGTNGSLSGSTGINITSKSNVIVKGCTIIRGNSTGNNTYGITAVNASSTAIIGNNITTNGTNDNIGIYVAGIEESSKEFVRNLNDVNDPACDNSSGDLLTCKTCFGQSPDPVAGVDCANLEQSICTGGTGFISAMLVNFTATTAPTGGRIQAIGGELVTCSVNGNKVLSFGTANNCGTFASEDIPASAFQVGANDLTCQVSGAAYDQDNGFKLVSFRVDGLAPVNANINLENNTVRTDGGNKSYGIFINVDNSTIRLNDVTTLGEQEGHAIYLAPLSDGNILFNNTMSAQAPNSDGLHIENAKNNSLHGNIYSSATMSKLRLEQSLENTFVLSSILGPNGLFISENDGTINYTGNIGNLSETLNLSAFVAIGLNSTRVNDSAPLNTSASLTFYRAANTTGASAVIDVSESGTFVSCDDTQCTSPSYNEASGIMTYNVVNFTTYAAQSTIACGDLDAEPGLNPTVYTLTSDVSSTGTCFNITGNNVTLNCADFTINFSTRDAGDGIIAEDRINSTFTNCDIVLGNQTRFSLRDSILLRIINRTSGRTDTIEARSVTRLNWTHRASCRRIRFRGANRLRNISCSAGAVSIADFANVTTDNSSDNNLSVVITAENFTLEANAKINVSLNGFDGGAAGQNGSGPGGGESGASKGGGGGHGGKGGDSSTTLGGGFYGSSLDPNTKGSGGAGGSNQPGGAGGGTVTIITTNRVVINGDISADGEAGGSGSNGGGGGSGGSINIIADQFDGNGTLSAIGANGGTTSFGNFGGGGGGGGRIIVRFNTTTFDFTSANVDAGNGATGGAGPGDNGDVGTLGFLDVDDNTLYLLDGWRFQNPDVEGVSHSVNATNTLVRINESNINIISGSMIFSNSQILSRNDPYTVSFNLTGAFTLTSGSTMTNATTVNITAANITVSSDSAIAMNGSGFGENGGPGVGGQGGGGAGHGGRGGGASAFGGAGQPYGSSLNPITRGSGGRTGTFGQVAGAGGGVALLTAENVVINGSVNADGRAPDTLGGSGTCAGGGAGGSVSIVAGSFTGSGSLSADGGNSGGTKCGSGSGGRIMVRFNTTTFDFSNTNVLAGGGGTGRNGQPGSLGFLDLDDDILSIRDGWRWQNADNTTWSYSVLNITDALTRAVNQTLNFTGGSVIIHNSQIVKENNSYNLSFDLSGGFTLSGTSAIENASEVNVSAVNITIALGSSIDLNGSGFGENAGPGVGGQGGGGAGHGGRGGGASAFGGAGQPYGSSLNPITRGSGGRTGTFGQVAGAGGGVALLTAENVVINGSVNADGRAPDTLGGSGTCAGGGAGGSVSIVAGSFTGSGSLSADGGNSGGTKCGSGSGGRIMVRFNTTTFDFSNTNVLAGGGGTGRNGQPGSLGFLDLDDDILSIRDGWRWQNEDREVWNFAVVNLTDAFTRAVNQTVNFIGDTVIIHNSQIVKENNSYNLSFDVDALTLSGTSAIENATEVNITAVNVTINSSAAIKSNGSGFARNTGPERGTAGGSGGGHGGDGGNGAGNTGKGHHIGSAFEPITVGSGGRTGTFGQLAAEGGGSIQIQAENLILHGDLAADGQSVDQTGGSGTAAGGAAGGSINIRAHNITGSGSISANGGNSGAPSGGGGGGGRIMIRSNTSTIPISSITVTAGAGRVAEKGTIGLLDVDSDTFTPVSRFHWLTHDAPFSFTTFSSSEPVDIESNGTTLVISGSFSSDKLNWTTGGSSKSTINATNIIFTNATITATTRLHLEYDTIFNDANATYPSGAIITLQNGSNTRIEWLQSFNANVQNLSDNVRIGEQIAFVNSSAQTGLNRSANITFIAVPFLKPDAVADFGDTGTFSNCPESICTPDVDAESFGLEVTSFTTYAFDEGVLTKTDNIDPVNMSSELNYTILVNVTLNNASNITVREAYSNQTRFVSASPTPEAGTNNTFLVGNLTAGEFFTINITLVTLNISDTLTINNTANMTYTNNTGGVKTVNVTESTTVSLANSPPSIDSIVLNTTDPTTNFTDENLTATFVGVTDIDGDPVQNITDWRLDGSSWLKLNMPFETNHSSNTAANRIRDYTTNENNATLGGGVANNAPAWNGTGPLGGYYVFDGSSDFISIPTSSDLISGTNNWTVMGWLILHAFEAEPENMIAYSVSGGNVQIYVTDTTMNVFGVDEGIIAAGHGLGSTVGTWVHYTWTRNGTFWRLYTNGVEIGNTTKTKDLLTPTASYKIGSIGTGGGQFTDGNFDEVKVWGRALSTDQILSIYNEENAGHHFTTVLSNETAVGEIWTVAVTPNDNQPNTDGDTVTSNSVTILGAFTITAAGCSPSEPDAGLNTTCSVTKSGLGDLDTILANVTFPNSSILASFIVSDDPNYNFTFNDTTSFGQHNVSWFANNTAGATSTAQDTFSVTGSIPTVNSAVLSTTDSSTNSTAENLTLAIDSIDLDGDPVYNITDWRINGSSWMLLNMPFTSNISDSGSNRIRDYSAEQNNGTLTNGAFWNNSLIGGAVELAGGDDYVSIADSPVWAFGSNDFTIDLWVNFDAINAGSQGSIPNNFISHDQGGGSQPKWIFTTTTSVISFHINNPGQGSAFLADTSWTPQAAAWYHLAIRRSGNNFTIYINGTPGTSETSSLPVPDAAIDVRIGTSEGLGFIDGTIDEVHIWNKSLSDEMIKSIHDQGRQGHSILEVVNDETEEGQNWSVVVTPNDLKNNTDGTSLESNTVTIQAEPPNSKPTIDQVILNTTDPSANDTNQNLTVFIINATDSDGSLVINITDFRIYNNSEFVSIARLNMPFETNKAGDVSAAAIRDYSTFENNGTLGAGTAANAPVWSLTDQIGGAYDYDDSNDYIEVDDSPTLRFNTSDDITLAAWIKPESLSGLSTIFLKGRTIGSTNRANYALRAEGSNKLIFYFRNSGDSAFPNAVSTAALLGTDIWQHVAITYTFGTESTFRMYVNGSIVAHTIGSSLDVAPFVSTEPLWIGAMDSSGGANTPQEPFDGLIDEVMVFNRSLSSEQIAQLYNDTAEGRHLLTIVSNETAADEIWQVVVTPNDNQPNTDGNTTLSNNVTIQEEVLVSTCGNISASTTLLNDVTSDGLCFNFTNDNITLDCDGFTILYDADGVGGDGVVATARTNVTVRNCTIIDINALGASGVGINFAGTNDSFIINNTIQTNGTNSNVGIQLTSNRNNQVASNTISTQGSSSANYGIFLSISPFNNITSNVINTNGTTNNNGIQSGAQSGNNTITNNTINTGGSGGQNKGIVIGSGDVTIVSNTITTNGSFTNTGIDITSSINHTVINNSITTDGTSQNNRGIVITTSNYTQITGNTISTNGTLTNDGIFLSGVNYDIFENNNITTSGSKSFGVLLGSSNDNNSFTNTLFSNPVEWILSNSETSTLNNFTNISFISDGTVRFDGMFQINGTQNISHSVLNATLNVARMNATNLTFMNTTALITLTGLTFTNAQVVVDFDEDGTNETCPVDVCTDVSYDGSTFIFNVSHWTTFAAQEEVITSCGSIGGGTTIIGSNLQSSGDCITVTSNDATINCNGNSIIGIGGSAGKGIDASSRSNVLIKDCVIANFSTLIDLSGASGTNITNVTLRPSGSTYIVGTSSSVGNNLTNATFEGTDGSIRFTTNLTLAAGANISTQNLNITNNRVFINISNISFMNVSAFIQLEGLTGAINTPQVDFEDDGSFVECPADVCTKISDAGGTLKFNVSHWTAFASDPETSTNLTIFDETDSEIEFPGDVVEFFADYFNGSNNADILGASCNASFGDDDTTQAMTFNVPSFSYKTTKIVNSAGTFDWNVSCGGIAAFAPLNVSDTFTITPPGVPEFSTWAIIIALSGVLVGFFFIRRRGM